MRSEILFRRFGRIDGGERQRGASLVDGGPASGELVVIRRSGDGDVSVLGTIETD